MVPLLPKAMKLLFSNMISLFTVAPEVDLEVQVDPSDEVKRVSLSPVVTQILFP